ncbi:MAG: hypothetical protein RQ728_06165 [Brevefilum sp.]|nr:hypothetical protein [Brevefilum sp.]MDT8381824.1 hypothetical protein [Brevefilum sp.]
MKKYKTIYSAALLLLLIFASLGIVRAQELPQELPPARPSSFYGTVMVNGQYAPAGANVSAWIDGEKVASTAVEYFEDEDAYVYTLKISSDGSIEEGAMIEFRYNNQYLAAETGSWHEGTNEPLDLTFTFSEENFEIFLPLVVH